MDEKDKENKDTEIDDENNDSSEENEEDNYLAVGMCMGMCLGMIVGNLLFKNIGIGMSIGMCLGLACFWYNENRALRNKKHCLKLLSKMTMTTGFDTAIEAFEEGIKLGASDLDSIWATYCRLTTGTLPEPEVSLPDTVPELKKYTPNIQVYDELIVSGGLQL